MNDFDQLLEKFKEAMIEINNYQNFTDSLIKRLSAYEQLLEDNNLIKKRSEITENDWSSTVNFLFKDYSTGITLNSLGVSKFIKKDSIRIELELKNRQYQFLLLNAFEAFEQYLKGAELFIDNKPKNENKKNFSPTKFIVNLHKTVPVISTIIKFRNESNPKFLDEVDLLLTFSLIEQLRHQITHSSGYANNKSLFIKKCLERVARYNNGQPKSEYTDYLNSFFGINQYESLICLIEIRDQKNLFYYYDRLGDLVRELTSYVIFIHTRIKITSGVAISAKPLAASST